MHERIKQNEETGGVTVEKPTITISLERYEELIKKEALYDQIADEYNIEPYLVRKEVKQYGYA